MDTRRRTVRWHVVVAPALAAVLLAATLWGARVRGDVLLAATPDDPLLGALRFGLLLVGSALVILAGGRLAGAGLALVVMQDRAGRLPRPCWVLLGGLTLVGLALLAVIQRAL